MSRLTDTSPEAQRVFDEVHRTMPAWKKWTLLDELYRFGRSLHAVGLAQRRPGITEAEIRADWATTHLGGCCLGLPIDEKDAVDQPIEFRRVIERVIAILDALGIDYALSGSLASSIHGINRNTIDADITVEPFPGQESAFVASFGPEYYVSLDAVRAAVGARSSFNVIHTIAGVKVDLFVRKDQPFDRSVMTRRQAIPPREVGDRSIRVVTPEDIILLKLEWYRLGHEISDRQWCDVLGVLRVQAGRLDWSYLDSWAGALGIADLLARARSEAQV
jgi:hypothetical protein